MVEVYVYSFHNVTHIEIFQLNTAVASGLLNT